MGLTVCVGVLLDLAEEDPEELDNARQEFDELNAVLRRAGLAEHREPTGGWQPLSFDMFGYSGLHYLRRVAAYLDAQGALPPPGDDDSADDPVLQAYYQRAAGGSGGGVLGRFRRRAEPTPVCGGFDHLINHSDAEGYYVPQQFEGVLIGADVPGELVGSAHVLREELLTLRDALELPASIDPEDDALWQAAESQGEGEATWECYGVESFTCVRLLAAAEASVERGAAIVFS